MDVVKFKKIIIISLCILGVLSIAFISGYAVAYRIDQRTLSSRDKQHEATVADLNNTIRQLQIGEAEKSETINRLNSISTDLQQRSDRQQQLLADADRKLAEVYRLLGESGKSDQEFDRQFAESVKGLRDSISKLENAIR